MERVWLSGYEEGVPADINPEAYASVAAVFEQSCSRFAAREAFRNMGGAITFAQFDRLARDFAAYLQQGLGLEKGDRIALMMPNVMQYPIALFGALRAGLVVVNVNPLYTARELEHQLMDAEPRAIVLVENFCHTLQEAQKKYPVDNVIVTGLGDMLGAVRGTFINFAVRHIKRMVKPWSIPWSVRWKTALSEGAEQVLQPTEISGDDTAFLQYTGGTTGVAKGAMLTHRNMVSNLEQISAWLRCEEGTEVIVTPLPLYHIFSLTANLLNFVKHGGTNVLITNPRDIPTFVKTLKNIPFTAMTGVNTLFNALVHNEEFRQLDFSHFRLTVGGGMAVQRTVAERWQEVTGTVVVEGYGLTETSPVLCANPIHIREFSGTIGLPLPSTEISIRDDNGEPVAFDEPGELCARGPQVMAGYWKKPEETQASFHEGGWFRTGDVASMSPQGWVRIVDRMKDMINVSGFKVFPNEVEAVAAEFDGVLEAGCVGIPDDESGEVAKLYVVPEADTKVDIEALRNYLRDNLTGYKVPKKIDIIDELPKSNVGKILRRELRDRDGEASES
jgi:long-chain acyl-CoA synthetase